jgi:hypothetical protein
MSVIDLWEIDSAGEETKRRIIRESRRINMFVTINMILMMTWATSHVICYDPSETVFVRHTLHLLFPRLATFLVVLFNLTTFVAKDILILSLDIVVSSMIFPVLLLKTPGSNFFLNSFQRIL